MASDIAGDRGGRLLFRRRRCVIRTQSQVCDKGQHQHGCALLRQATSAAFAATRSQPADRERSAPMVDPDELLPFHL